MIYINEYTGETLELSEEEVERIRNICEDINRRAAEDSYLSASDILEELFGSYVKIPT